MKPQNSDLSVSNQARALEPVAIVPPPIEQQKQRLARFAQPGEKRGRYHLPESLDSGSPVGFRRRVSMTENEVQECLPLLSLGRPEKFVPGPAVTEGELFEECSLGVLTARQSTNFRGHRDVVLGAEDSTRMTALLRQLKGLEATPLDGASHTHVVFCRPYRTPFTLLLTFIGHSSLTSPWTVATRAWRKKFQHADDIPTIRWLMHVHLGVLADAMERATVIASGGKRRANSFMVPLCGDLRFENRAILRDIELLAGLTAAERSAGWRVALVTQAGTVAENEQIKAQPETLRKLGANLLAFRSERIQPGINQEEKAPDAYQQRQTMDIPDELTVQAGRAAYNAFAHFTGCDREIAKSVLLLDRIDVLTPNGKERIREVREMLDYVTDRVVNGIPLWADLATAKNLSSNAARGKKAFALAGQRIYIGGLSGRALRETGMDMELATRAFGAAAARSALVAELMGVMGLPETCDLLAGICLMAGPVNQNDIGKSFYGQVDLLHKTYPNEEPTSLLVWTLKAKTVADPIGNEEQLMNAARKGALVDLRTAPHEVVSLRVGESLQPMRRLGVRVNQERAFEDVGNFVTDPDGFEIPGNRGTRWPDSLRNANPFSNQLSK
jgi:hypothetical protein